MKSRMVFWKVDIVRGFRSRIYLNNTSLVFRLARDLARVFSLGSGDDLYSFPGTDQEGRPVLLTYLDKKGLGGEDEIEEARKKRKG